MKKQLILFMILSAISFADMKAIYQRITTIDILPQSALFLLKIQK